jgi:hypothetical protein
MLRTTAAAVLAAAAAATTAALATPAVAAAPPAQVHLDDVRCQDMSQTIAMLPEQQAHVPMVTYRITAGENAPLTDYQLKVNGESRASGSVGAKDRVVSSISIPNDQEVTVAVTSKDKTLATRTYHPSC